MKSAIAIGCLLLAVSSASAQIVYLEQERSITARAELSRTDYPLPGQDYHRVEEQALTAMNFGLFDETVMVSLHESGADADATAWQHSTLSPDEILARGGPRNVTACCQSTVDISAIGSS
jgi:hypothetical protein